MNFIQILLRICLLFHFINRINGTPCSISESEYNALNDFYIYTNGEHWKNRENKWEFPIPFDPIDLNKPCDTTLSKWYGLTCIELDNDVCSIIHINLERNNLRGRIAKEIDKLTNLQYLFLNDNYLTGSIPIQLFNFTNLTQIGLYSNQLNGSLPSQIANLAGLTYLDLSNNQFSNFIPSELMNLVTLEHLNLNDNLLSSSIPTQLGYLNQLLQLRLNNNQLTGSIPTQLGNLIILETLLLGKNPLSGSIPSQLGHLNKLFYLNLQFNQLSSSIPTELGQLVNLTKLYLNNNQLSNSIPTELGQFDKLIELYLYNNKLSGSIPTELGSLSELIFFQLENNQLSSSIPSELGNLGALNDLYLYNNRLSGSIPSQLNKITTLSTLFLYNNTLNGIIPSLENLYLLTFLYLSNNSLSGTIPTELGNLTIVSVIYLDNNQLTGSIPSQLSNLASLTDLVLDSNYLSGSIPSQLGNLDKLNTLDLSYNNLNGEIPTSFNQLYNIVVFLLTSNKLTGNIDGIFDSNNQTLLRNIDLVNNLFSGSIPSNVFDLSSLETFAISNNCIKGSLPIEICSSTTLSSLILDGINANCGRFVFSSFKTYYASSYVIEGGIPNCVFNMSSLTTLHVSGNSIIGTLSNDIVLSKTLTSLDLSTNLYSAEIPAAIQNYQWQYLNLGFNKFKDTIIDTVPNSNNSTLVLTNNRISGLIPSSLDSYSNISILDGNIFSCSSVLPNNDPLYADYQCGTYYFYVLLLIFSLITIVIILIKLRFYKDDDNIIQNVWYKNIDRLRITGTEIQHLNCFRPSSLIRNNNDNSLMKDLSNGDDNDKIIRITDYLSYQQDSNISLLLIISENLQQCLFYIIVFNICLWLLSSTILHQYYSTYDFMYGYNLTMTFLSGYPSAIVLLILITISIIFIYFLINGIIFKSKVNDRKDMEKMNDKKSKSNHFWMFLLVFIINMIVMVIVNVLYVFASLDPERYNKYIELFAVLLAIFKTGWKSYLLPLLLSILTTNKAEIDATNKSKDNKYFKFNIVFLCIIGILNIIVIPLLTTSFLSHYCFYYSLIPQSEISSSYNYIKRQIVFESNGGVFFKPGKATRTSSYQPPFEYSYQCANTLMTTYDSVYIYMSLLLIIISLLVPFIKTCVSKVKNKRIKKLMNKFVPSKLKPLESSFTNYNNYKSELFKKKNEGNDGKEIKVNLFKTCYKISRKYKINAIFLNQTQYIVDIVIFMTLSVTIGFMIPLVGIIICISLYLYIHSVLSNISGKLTNATIEDKEILEKECENIFENLSINLNSYIYPIMGIFFSLFVFDIIGDVEGSDVAIFYFIFTLLIPFILWLIKRYLIFQSTQQEEKEDEDGISLQTRISEVCNPFNNSA
jgi:Leucine-rich repeat (LRR) protein